MRQHTLSPHCHCFIPLSVLQNSRPCGHASCDGLLSIGGQAYAVLVQTSCTQEIFAVQPMAKELAAIMLLKSPTKVWVLPGSSQPTGVCVCGGGGLWVCVGGQVGCGCGWLWR